MTSVFVIGDPHFQTSNLENVEIFINRCLKCIETYQPDFIVCLGDLLHTHETLHIFPLNKAYQFLKEMSNLKPTFLIIGNHDLCSATQFLTTNHGFNSFKEIENLTVVDHVIEYQSNDHSFIMVPYVYPGRFEEALLTKYQSINDIQHVNAIFAHQEFYGCKMGAIVSEVGDKWNLDYPLIISGHIHDKQQPQSNIVYVGSSMQHAFGESDTKTLGLFGFDQKMKLNSEIQEFENDIKFTEAKLDILDKNVQYLHLNLLLQRKRIEYTTVDNLENVKINNEDQTKIVISGSAEQFKTLKKTDKYKELVSQGIKIAFKPDKKINEQLKQEYQNQIETKTNSFAVILKELIVKEHPRVQEIYTELNDN